MTQTWTFGRRIAISFAVIVLLAGIGGMVAFAALRTVVASKDRVIEDGTQTLVGANESPSGGRLS